MSKRFGQFPGISRLGALFCLCAVVPLALLVSIPLHMATASLGTSVRQRLSTTSSVSASSISHQMQALQGLVNSFAETSDFTNGGAAASAQDPAGSMRTALRSMQKANPDIETVFVLDSTGRVMTVEPWNSPNIGGDYSFRDYYRSALGRSNAYVSGVFQSNSGAHAKLVSISKTIIDPTNQQMLGVLVAVVDVNSILQQYVDQFNKDNGVVLTIYDQNNNIVARPGSDTNVVKSDDFHATDARNGQGWTGTRTVGKTSYVYAYSPVSEINWSVSAAVTAKSAYSPIRHLRSGVMAIAGVLGIVIFLALLLLGRSMRARDRAQSRLESSEERSQGIVETASQGYYELDSEGRIIKWNAQSEQMFGWLREEVLGKTLIEVLVPPDRREIALRYIEELFDDRPATRDRLNLEVEAIRNKSETPIPIAVTMWRTTFDGEKRLSAFVQDISERRRLEEERELIVKRQRHLVEELRQADKVKSDFISTVSHELRTPLTSIIGYLEMLRDGFGGDLTDQQSSMLDVVDRNSRRLLGLIDDVLTLSRLESNAMRGTNTSVDVASLITGVQQAMLPSIMERNLQFDVQVSGEAGSVVGDVNQLERVFLNLLSNAVKFTPEGGSVSLRVEREVNTVVIRVADTGIGIPIEEQDRLFSRFFRASSAQDHAIQGTGLGLAIVKSIVERHGGTIAIESELHVGTTVIVELPTAQFTVPSISQSV